MRMVGKDKHIIIVFLFSVYGNGGPMSILWTQKVEHFLSA